MASVPPGPPSAKDAASIDVTATLRNPNLVLGPILVAIEGWEEVPTCSLEFQQISGAMTNVVYKVTAPGATRDRSCIVRLFGPGSDLFSQAEERAIFSAAGRLGIGPRCLLEFPGGRAEELIPGVTLTAHLMRRPDVRAATASAMLRFHVDMAAGEPKAGPLGGLVSRTDRAKAGTEGARAGTGAPSADLDQALSSIPSGSDSPTPASLSVATPSPSPIEASLACFGPTSIWGRAGRWYRAAAAACPRDLARLGLLGTLDEVRELKDLIAAAYPAWPGFCHNDVQYGNALAQGVGEADLEADKASPTAVASELASRLGFAGATRPVDAAPGSPDLAAAEGVADGPGGRGEPPSDDEGPSSPPAPNTAPIPAPGLPPSSDGGALPALRTPGPASVPRPSATPPTPPTPSTPGPDGAWGCSPGGRGTTATGAAGRAASVHVRLIDYEYATPNDVAYDVANHFCEYAADYHSGASHELDFAALPTTEQGLGFCRSYVLSARELAAEHALAHGAEIASPSGGEGPMVGPIVPPPASGDELLDAIMAADAAGPPAVPAADASGVAPRHSPSPATQLLFDKALAYMPMSHLTWGLWGLIQQRVSDVDFDYGAYATQRIEQWHLTRRSVTDSLREVVVARRHAQ